MVTLRARMAAEACGTALLVAAVVGSGIMAERLAGGNGALALLVNTIATAATLTALILSFGPISGAQFNPAVTFVMAGRDTRWRQDLSVGLAQIAGGLIGTLVAHAMFSAAIWQLSGHVRSGSAQLFSEFVATFGLVVVIQLCARFRQDAIAYAVGLYIAGAYWFTASTSFANPAVTIARVFTDSFAGIHPFDAPGFIAAQLAGAFAATLFVRWGLL